MNKTLWIIAVATVSLSAVGCMHTSGDADDAEGGLALDVNGLGGEPAGDNNSLYNEINGDIANADEFMQEFMSYIADPPVDTEDTDTSVGGAVCDDLADCMCPMAAAADQAACYDAIDLMSETECTELYDQYASLC